MNIYKKKHLQLKTTKKKSHEPQESSSVPNPLNELNGIHEDIKKINKDDPLNSGKWNNVNNKLQIVNQNNPDNLIFLIEYILTPEYNRIVDNNILNNVIVKIIDIIKNDSYIYYIGDEINDDVAGFE